MGGHSATVQRQEPGIGRYLRTLAVPDSLDGKLKSVDRQSGSGEADGGLPPMSLMADQKGTNSLPITNSLPTDEEGSRAPI